MIKTTYQTPELRDSNDNIVQQGAFGKNTALSNSTNDGWIDYVVNNLEALHDTIGDSAPTLDGNGHVVEPANLAIGDEDGLRIKNNYLKLSGGIVTGIASFRTDLRMLDNQDNRFGGLYVPASSSTQQYMQLYGGTRTTGDARLTLYPSGDGHFSLLAYSNNGSNSYELRSDNAGNLNWRGYPLAWKKDYLPLTGGTLTGNVTWNMADVRLKRSDETGTMSLYAGIGWNKSASLILYGSERSSNVGEFNLSAHDGTNRKQLIGRPSGTLTWDSKNIERVNAIGTNYIRYESGLQICWGSVTGTGNATTTAITFQQPFVNNSYFGYANLVTSSSTVNVNTGSYSTTGMTAYHTSISAAPFIRWIAIGNWQ